MRWSLGRGGFTGMRPRRDSRYNGESTSIVDANLIHGDLRPLPCPEEKCDTGGVVETIVDIEENECCTFTECMSYTEDCGLYYWNDETGVAMISTPEEFCSGDGCEYVVQCPDAAPSVVASELAPDSSDTAACNAHFFSYRYSYIVEIGGREFEGHWSAPSECVLSTNPPNVTISGTPAINDGCHTKIRLYRAASGQHSGVGVNAEVLGGWYVVGDYPMGAIITDNLRYTELQRPDPIMPDEYGSPPPNLRSIGKTDNGVIFGIEGQCLHYTIPCRPMSWSPRRKICIPEHAGTPLLACARGQDVYVLTDKFPVFLDANLSDSGIGFRMNIIQKRIPLVSKASVTKGYQGIYYASTDGYYTIERDRPSNLTQEWFGRDDWCKLKPETISGVVAEDSLVWASEVDAFMLSHGDVVSQISNSAGNPRRSAQLGGQTLVGLNLNGTMIGSTAHMLDCDNNIRFAKDGIVYCWDWCKNIIPAHHKDKPDESQEDPCCEWTYCDFIDVDQCMNFSRLEVKFDIRTLTDGITIKLYKVDCGEQELITEEVITDCEPIAIPGCVISERFLLEASGCETVKHLSFASSLQELVDQPTPQGAAA